MLKLLLKILFVLILLVTPGFLTTRGHLATSWVTPRVYADDPWTKVSQPVAGQIAAGGTTMIESARSFAVFNGSLYLGTKKDNSAEVYRYDGGATWTLVSQATPGQIAPGGTGSIDGVQTMIVHDSILYIGTQETNLAEVYSFDGTNWGKVSQPTGGQIAAGGLTSIDRVQITAVLDGSLYIGTLETNRAEIYRYDGATAWTRVSKGAGRIAAGGTKGIDAVDSMVVHNSQLYVGTVEINRAEVYRFDGGNLWTKVSQPTPGQIDSGGTASINGVETMEVHNGSLYAGTNEPGLAEVYRYEIGTDWTKVSQPTAGQIAAGGTASIGSAHWLAEYNLNLYLGTGKTNQGEVYRYDGDETWTKVSQPTPGQIDVGGTTGINVASVGAAVLNGLLYIGTDEFNRGEVYAFTDAPPP